MDNFLTRCIILVKKSEPYIEARYIAVRYIMPNWTIKSVKDFYLTWYIAALCKVILLDKISYNQLAKMQKIQVIVIFSQYPLSSSMGDILHYKTFVRLQNQGHVFHSHVTLKNPTQNLSSHPLHHKLYQIPAQLTQNPQINFDTHFDKTLIFPSKTKLSDNLKI